MNELQDSKKELNEKEVIATNSMNSISKEIKEDEQQQFRNTEDVKDIHHEEIDRKVGNKESVVVDEVVESRKLITELPAIISVTEDVSGSDKMQVNSKEGGNNDKGRESNGNIIPFNVNEDSRKKLESSAVVINNDIPISSKETNSNTVDDNSNDTSSKQVNINEVSKAGQINEVLDQKENSKQSDSNNREKAAVKIQRFYRAYRVKKANKSKTVSDLRNHIQKSTECKC